MKPLDRFSSYCILALSFILAITAGCGGSGMLGSTPTGDPQPTATPTPTPVPSPTPNPSPTPSPSPSPTPAAPRLSNIIVVVMQNRSFDHLFGTFPGANGIQPGEPGFTQTDASGKTVSAFFQTNTAIADLPHLRGNLTADWDNGLMDKFAFTGGDDAMGHYDNTTPGVDLLWSWAQQFALADNFFPSAMGDAPSNQLYLIAASDKISVSAFSRFTDPATHSPRPRRRTHSRMLATSFRPKDLHGPGITKTMASAAITRRRKTRFSSLPVRRTRPILKT